MDKTESTFGPEWLIVQSFVIVDDKSASKSSRNKSLDNDLGSSATSHCSSFGQNRDRDRDSNKEKTGNRFRDYSDSLANILPSWFEKDGVKCSHQSHSNASAKRVDSSPRKAAIEKIVHNNKNVPFQRDFPSHESEEKEVDFEFVRVSSPVLSSVVGGDVWTSALADVPMVGTKGPTSISATANVTAGRNMAETLAHSSHPQTAHQSTVGSQRLEELAVRQSRPLIPAIPMSESLSLNSSDKPKIKIVSPGSVSVNADGGKLPNSPPAAPLDRKAFTPEKRPSPKAKSRYDFFNLMWKKFMANNSPNIRSTDSVDDKGGGESITKNGKNVYSEEEEEARFLRSLGWEETTEEGLTEEEINSFYRDLSKYVNSRTGFKGRLPKCLLPIILQMGKNKSDAKVDS